jgi:hypothetical protein
MANVLEQVYVIEKRAPQQDHVTTELKDFRESKGGIQSVLGLASGEAARYIQSRCKAEGTIEWRSIVLQPALISNRCEKEESRWKQIPGTRKGSPKMDYHVAR